MGDASTSKEKGHNLILTSSNQLKENTPVNIPFVLTREKSQQTIQTTNVSQVLEAVAKSYQSSLNPTKHSVIIIEPPYIGVLIPSPLSDTNNPRPSNGKRKPLDKQSNQQNKVVVGKIRKVLKNKKSSSGLSKIYEDHLEVELAELLARECIQHGSKEEARAMDKAIA